MEKKNEASCSLEPANHDSSHQESEWLHVSLSDLNKRMQTIVTLLDEDGKSTTKSQMHLKRRPELIQILEELDRSYRSLDDKFHQLMSNLYQVSNADPKSSSLSDTNKNKRLVAMSDDSIIENFGSYPFHIAGNPEAECEDIDSDFEYLNKLAEELMLTEQGKMKANMELKIRENPRGKEIAEICGRENVDMNLDGFDLVQAYNDFSKSNEKTNSWSKLELQLTKLMEENLHHQKELARRNIEKKMVIERLRLEMAHLKEENRALQSCISCLKVGDKYNQFRTSKLRALFSGKLFQGCS